MTEDAEERARTEARTAARGHVPPSPNDDRAGTGGDAERGDQARPEAIDPAALAPTRAWERRNDASPRTTRPGAPFPSRRPLGRDAQAGARPPLEPMRPWERAEVSPSAGGIGSADGDPAPLLGSSATDAAPEGAARHRPRPTGAGSVDKGADAVAGTGVESGIAARRGADWNAERERILSFARRHAAADALLGRDSQGSARPNPGFGVAATTPPAPAVGPIPRAKTEIVPEAETRRHRLGRHHAVERDDTDRDATDRDDSDASKSPETGPSAAEDVPHRYPWQRQHDVDLDLEGAPTRDPSDYPDEPDDAGARSHGRRAAKWLLARRPEPGTGAAEPPGDRTSAGSIAEAEQLGPASYVPGPIDVTDEPGLDVELADEIRHRPVATVSDKLVSAESGSEEPAPALAASDVAAQPAAPNIAAPAKDLAATTATDAQPLLGSDPARPKPPHKWRRLRDRLLGRDDDVPPTPAPVSVYTVPTPRPRPAPGSFGPGAPGPTPELTPTPRPVPTPEPEPMPVPIPAPIPVAVSTADRPRPGPGQSALSQPSKPAPAAAIPTPVRTASPRPRPRPAGAPQLQADAPTITSAPPPSPSPTPIPSAAPSSTFGRTYDPDLSRFLEASEPQPGDDEKEPPEPGPLKRFWVRRRRGFLRLGIVLIVAAIAVVLLRTYVVAPYYIPSASMEPTLHGCPGCDDDHILVDKITYRFHDPRRSDIVVFDRPKGAVAEQSVLVKRVIGLPGDKVQMKNGVVFIGGVPLAEPYLNRNHACYREPISNFAPRIIAKDQYLMLGDNRCDSSDSRVFGTIAKSSIVGRAWLIIWPLKRIGTP